MEIQKIIISNFIDLVQKDLANETEISDLINTIERLYKVGILTNNDIYRLKIEIINSKLKSALALIKTKKKYKSIKLTIEIELLQILEENIKEFKNENLTFNDIEKISRKDKIEITPKNVHDVCENLIIHKTKLISESNLEKFISNQIALIFGNEQVHRQFSVGGFLALKTDIDIGNGKVGIELKIADNLSATDMQRIIGQVVYYKKRFYHNNLLLLIVGKSKINPIIKELIDFIEELGVKVIYLKAIKF